DFYFARLGAAYVRQERWEPALRSLERAAAIAPDNPVHRYALADILILFADGERARQEVAGAGPLDEYALDGLRRWRARSGVIPLTDAGMLPAYEAEIAPPGTAPFGYMARGEEP
ncbi:MAG: tetratricopeptide repeat protein, partial [Armatimonadetes bacterium]|nr:tetratricopeptide repeat protein [Armatimonadota bacterium]